MGWDEMSRKKRERDVERRKRRSVGHPRSRAASWNWERSLCDIYLSSSNGLSSDAVDKTRPLPAPPSSGEEKKHAYHA